MKRLIAFLCLYALMAGSMRAQTPTGDVLVRNATVLTVTQGTLESTDILVRDGIIAAVGENLSAPSDVPVIEASGHYVMPGIIDAHSHIGISNVNESSAPVTAQVSVGDVLNPYSISIYRALAGGVTTSHVMHGSANVIGGQNETIKHRWGIIDPEELRMAGAPRTIKFALGENPTRVHGRGTGKRPASRMGVEYVLRETLTKAQRYQEEWNRYEQEVRTNPRAVSPAYNGQLEVMSDILNGDILINCHSYRADEILMLMDVLKDFGIQHITFQHVNEGFKIAPELAEFGAYASIFADWWAYKFEVYYSTAYNAAILTRNGVLTSINSDSGELNRHLYHEAAKSQKYGGLSDDEALALITINPARQLGIDERVGSIEVGKDGDLAIFDRHPLSVYAVNRHTIVDGIPYFNADRDADDMRLAVDPESRIDTVILHDHHDDHLCLHEGELDLYDFLTNH
ncbi:MAG: amidohydrolase family protein [Bacteroidota bacterium]|nr:amidohydrolase family protein [Bacteroidota bacterium]MDE2834048.1 amidohydrolase family protein [Bacteroidota bacterium]MDE2957481.1 amidohydrolase family protein [Bacteroidota bacterium]